MNLPLRPRSRNTTIPGTLANSVSSLPLPTFSPGLKRVPRCRTRIEPPVTNSPPKALTPNRWALESRPFFELPRPFLCAIPCLCQNLDLCQNLAYGHLGIILPMSDRPFVLLLPLELKHDYFVTASMSRNGAFHSSLAERGACYNLVRIVHHGEHAVKFNFRADLAGKRLHLNYVARSDAVLLPAGF